MFTIAERIAVLNKGRKVFEGLIADVRAARGRVMLKTPDFTGATKLLNERGFISGSVDGKFISLKEGRTTADVVSALVGSGIAVEGIWQQDQTLEDFYLSIVKNPPPIPGSN